jgi:squalene cyclase
VDTAGYALFTLELGGHKPDENTEAVVEYLLKDQANRDHWRTTANRPPTEASSFTRTYVGLRGLRVWATESQKEKARKRIAAVRDWVVKTRPKDTEDRVFRLFALKEVDADEKELAAASWELMKTQRPDGGWAQLDSMSSDAYATGTALVALHQAGGLATDHPAYARGVGFLLKTQLADGSWYVKSRSKPFQPYYESGFPHGKDQFISAATSGWATTALLLATKPE